MHSFRLILNEPVAIVGREQIVFLAAIVDVEVLNARVQQLHLGALALEVRPATMPAFDFTITLWTTRCAALTLDEGQSLAVRIAHALQLQSWRGYIVGEQANGLDNCLQIVVGSLCHVLVRQCWRKRSGQSRCSLRPLTHASVDRAYQAESVGSNSLVTILIAIRRSPNL